MPGNEAAVHVVLKVLGQLQFPFERLGHQRHTRTGGFGLAQAVLVGGAHRQAQPTADTVVDILLGRALKPFPGGFRFVFHVLGSAFYRLVALFSLADTAHHFSSLDQPVMDKR
jgi:hypothetical protein